MALRHRWPPCEYETSLDHLSCHQNLTFRTFYHRKVKKVWSDDIIEASNAQHLKESTYLINENNYKIVVVVVVDVNRRRLSNQNFEFLQFLALVVILR